MSAYITPPTFASDSSSDETFGDPFAYIPLNKTMGSMGKSSKSTSRKNSSRKRGKNRALVVKKVADVDRGHKAINNPNGKVVINYEEDAADAHEGPSAKAESLKGASINDDALQGAVANAEGILANGKGIVANAEGIVANAEGIVANAEGNIANAEGIVANAEGIVANAVVDSDADLFEEEDAIEGDVNEQETRPPKRRCNRC